MKHCTLKTADLHHPSPPCLDASCGGFPFDLCTMLLDEDLDVLGDSAQLVACAPAEVSLLHTSQQSLLLNEESSLA